MLKQPHQLNSGASPHCGAAHASRSIFFAFLLISLGCDRDAGNEAPVPGSPSVVAPEPETQASSGSAVDPKLEGGDAAIEANGAGSGAETAPGGIELPEAGIPAETAPADPAPAEPAATEGLELPKDVDLPAADDSAMVPAVKYGTWKEIETLAKSTGRVTVVDLWSLACEPCLKEFPGLVRLHQDQGSKVQCIAVDLDFDGRKSRPPQHYESEVMEFLTSVDAKGFPTYISSTPSDEVFAAAKLVSIPAVFVFDANGDQAKVFVDAGDSVGFTYENDIIPLVKELLK